MTISKRLVLFTLALPMFFYNCNKETEDKNTINAYVKETHSYAKPNTSVIKHLDLDIFVNFKKKIIEGTAHYEIQNNKANEIILDAKFLEIENVYADGTPTNFELGSLNNDLGQALKISITKDTKTISVNYRTTAKTEALQWLNPQQTADKTDPFLFTQGQAILTRTWIPIQDSPQIRITYNATVRVPKNLMAVMSAENPKTRQSDGIYNFKMVQPISPYLIALAVGNFDYKEISERTGVYAEPSVLEQAYNEFADMENMVTAAENLYGAYDWDQFDVIVLPPSFPFGGMENPRLTFATPTIIAGDRSLTSLIAHELAHSWSGNLVTNATWDDFWLNEGFTVYFEIRIMEALYGVDRANMIAMIGRQDLDDELEDLKDEPEATKLKLDLSGKNPDDGMNSIAYDKGYLFLRTLEETVGREKFDAFLKGYFKTHAFTTITTEQFVRYLNANLLVPNQVSFNVDEWIYKPGVPTNQAIIASDRFANTEKTLAYYLKTETINPAMTEDWTTLEWVHFIRNFPEDMTVRDMQRLDDVFDLSRSTNSFIAMVWYEKAIEKHYHGNNVDKEIAAFLTRVGRRWYVNTLFKAFKTNERVDEALAIYKTSRQNYHSVTANTIDELLEFQP